jgi:mucolipin 3
LQVAVEYFENSAGQQPLTFSDKMEFINLWYIMIVVNDVLSIGGSIAKLLIETKVRFLIANFFFYFSRVCI